MSKEVWPEQQKNLKLEFTDYDLGQAWSSSVLVESIRQNLGRFLPKGLYDPQDLEHQVLFRLTTYDPSTITDSLLESVVAEQYLLVQEKLKSVDYDLGVLFRGLSGRYMDLNCFTRLEMQRDGEGKLRAVGNNYIFEVRFQKIEDKKLIKLFTEDLHYIHSRRDNGDAFGLFFGDDEIPFAVETTEPSTKIKQYKRDALLAHGIHPDKAVELTRFYTLPGAPRNAISLMDAEISKYFKPQGIEALITQTMPAYAKTKGATIAGGMNRVLLIKNLKHYFIPQVIERKLCYENVTRGYLKEIDQKDYIASHPSFPLLPIVEVFMPINQFSFDPIEEVKTKTIYVPDRNRD